MTAAVENKDATDEESSYPKPVYAWYVVVLMMCFYVLSFMDRQIIAVLIEPIKEDLALSDVQISLIGTTSFVIFYSIAGIFIGRLADKMNRPLLIAIGVFIWSLTTMLCGFVAKFWQLAILRMGVGLGESALLPSTLSMLSEYFPPKRRATPTSVFLFGAPIGIGLSFVIGGFLLRLAEDITAASGWEDVAVIGGVAAWKLVLIFLGFVGMLMTGALATVREPRNMRGAGQRKAETTNERVADAAPVSEVRRYAKRNSKAIVTLYVGMALVSLAAYAQGFWDLTFLSRVYEKDVSSIGFNYGMIQMFAGLAGMITGGVLADHLDSRGVRGSSVIMLITGCAISAPFSFVYPLANSIGTAYVLMTVAIFGSNMAFASAGSAVQRLFPSSMLGLAAGVYFFISNAVGIGIGPTAIAALTDWVFEDPQKINYSISIIGGISRVIALILVIAGLKAYKDLVDELDAESGRN